MINSKCFFSIFLSVPQNGGSCGSSNPGVNFSLNFFGIDKIEINLLLQHTKNVLIGFCGTFVTKNYLNTFFKYSH